MLKPFPASQRVSSRSSRVICLCACIFLLACNDGHGPTAGTGDFGNEGKNDDGGQSMHVDPPPPELDDAGMHVISSGETDLCVYDNADRFAIEQDVEPDVLGSAATRDGFGIVFQRKDGALFIDAISRKGAAQAPIAVTTASEQATGAMLFADIKQFVLAYRTEGTLAVRDLLHPDQAPNLLTNDLAIAADGSEVWAMAGGASGFTVAWMEGSADEPFMRARRLTTSGMPMGDITTLPAEDGRTASQIALARLQDSSLILAWKQEDANKLQAIVGQRISSGLNPVDKSVVLSKTPVADGRFSFQARRDSAGLLYPALDGGARKALKLRRVDDGGQPDGPVLNVANAPRVVQDGSLAPFGRGYALVYRELPSTHTATAQIRIAFVNPFGDVVYDAMLAETTEASAATSISAEEGELLLVSYVETDAKGTHIKALRMACPGALVLCGGNLE